MEAANTETYSDMTKFDAEITLNVDIITIKKIYIHDDILSEEVYANSTIRARHIRITRLL